MVILSECSERIFRCILFFKFLEADWKDFFYIHRIILVRVYKIVFTIKLVL